MKQINGFRLTYYYYSVLHKSFVYAELLNLLHENNIHVKKRDAEELCDSLFYHLNDNDFGEMWQQYLNNELC